MNIYQNLFDLINTYIYGNSVVAGSYQELVCILVATCACIFVFALPFLVVYFVIKKLWGWI